MDFEDSVRRLAKDQSKYRGRKNIVISEKARRQAEYQRKQQARLRVEREQKKRLEEHQKQYMHQGDRVLQIKSLGSFCPTSIWGEGDKIALPPSVLEQLTSTESNNVGNPWTFRIGILNPDYQFPSSALIQTMKLPKKEDDELMVFDSDEDDDEDLEAYRDELKHKYLAYTHCTVVEFTQDEGHIGVPQPIAQTLLRQKINSHFVKPTPVKRTVDPAGTEVTTEPSNQDQTPGHLAWGAFDIPDMQLEISLLKLPKGKGCTLVPTNEAIKSGFYGLKDIKLVLEQSLIRTRATLSVGDIVSSWHRGVEFELSVTKIIPASFNAVTSINTDIEVDFGETEASPEAQKPTQQQNSPLASESMSSGRTLGSGEQAFAPTSATTSSHATPSSLPIAVNLLSEPPADQKEGVCLAQIQHSGGHGKRRFLTTEARVQDLFVFASSLVGKNDFRLVTRFPRRVFISTENQGITLAEAGIQQGQERFMMEFL
jgi:hypothetical protein